MSFRWQGKYLLLTYPQSDFSLDECLSFLRSAASLAIFIRVCSEQHESGELHRHAFIVFRKRFSFTSERRFDFKDRHPNIKPRVDSPAGALNYVSKDGNFVDWGDCPNFGETERVPKESRNELFGRLLDEATNAEHFLQLVREASPYDFCTRYSQLDTMARAVFRPKVEPVPEYDPEDFDLPDTIVQWLEKEFDPEVSC